MTQPFRLLPLRFCPPRLAAGLAFALGAACAHGDTVRPEVDALFAGYDRPGVPGCALGMMQDGEFVYRRGYGEANLEYGIPLTSQSVFDTASTGKQFTAAAIALLAESGTLALDDRLSRWFPEFPAWAQDVTVEQLVYHTSGIRDYLQLAYLAGRGDEADHYSDEWVLRLLARQRETNFAPGTRHLYSNSGYLLLAHLVQRATGKSLREWSQENVFARLGMTITHFHDDQTELVPGRATGYAPDGDRFRLSMSTLDMVGDGGVVTTVDELLLWERNYYANRLGSGSPALVEQLTTPGRLEDGTPLDYAFGLGTGEYRGLKTVHHGGAWVGYRSELIRFPEQRFAVAVLCNRADAAPERLARQVADYYLADRLAPLPAEAADPQPVALDAAAMAAYTGDFWEHDEAFAAEVRVIDGKLWAVHSPSRRDEMVYLGDHRFTLAGVPAEVYVDYTLDGESIVSVHRTINGEPRGTFTPFTRRSASAVELAEYAGDYFSAELDVGYALRIEDGRLMFHLDDEPPQEVVAMFADIFENADYGSFAFQRDAGGQIAGFLLQSGRVRNLHFVRQQD